MSGRQDHVVTLDLSDDERHGLLQSTIDVFLDRTRAVAELLGAAGGAALGTMPDPVPATVTRMLSSFQQLAQQVPSVTAELDVLIEEVHAHRLSIQAVQAELAALDRQLEVLERSLVPVQAWSRQWNRVRRSLTESLHPTGAP